MLIRGFRDLDTFQLDDLSMRTRISKPEYVNPNALQPSLMRRAKEAFGRDVRLGDSLEYLKCRGGYKLRGEVERLDEIDKKYYGGVVEKGLYIFGYGSLKEKELKKQRKQEFEESHGEFDFLKDIDEEE